MSLSWVGLTHEGGGAIGQRFGSWATFRYSPRPFALIQLHHRLPASESVVHKCNPNQVIELNTYATNKPHFSQ